jgi:hypothetical protein
MGEEGSKDGEKLRKRILRLEISYGRIGTDDWDSFVSAFGERDRTGERTWAKDLSAINL